jgi:transmembrane sensor
MNMQGNDTIGDVASDWLARLESPACTSADRAAFEDWLAASPAHVEAYLDVERIHALATALAGDEMLHAVAARARNGKPPRRMRRWQWLPAMAAVLVLAVGAALWWGPAPDTVVGYATAIGEQREVILDDGTRMRLDTDTEVTTRFGRKARIIELAHGRAQFEVGHDPARPFMVRAGAGTVRDIGTTFQVARHGDRVTVGLIEGAVRVSHGDDGPGRTLAPGERVQVDAKGRFSLTQALDLAVATAWPRGELVFKRRRLDDLVAEVNRYSEVPLRLADPALGGITVSGVFRADDQAGLVAALERGWALRAERTDKEEIVLHGPIR